MATLPPDVLQDARSVTYTAAERARAARQVQTFGLSSPPLQDRLCVAVFALLRARANAAAEVVCVPVPFLVCVLYVICPCVLRSRSPCSAQCGDIWDRMLG